MNLQSTGHSHNGILLGDTKKCTIDINRSTNESPKNYFGEGEAIDKREHTPQHLYKIPEFADSCEDRLERGSVGSGGKHLGASNTSVILTDLTAA